MARLTHKQLLYELRTVIYPITGLDTRKLRVLSKKLQTDSDPNMQCIGSFVERACKLLENPDAASYII